MATLNIPSKTYVSATSTWSITWNISNLSNPFNTTNYVLAVIASSGVTDGTTTTPSYYASITPPSSGISTTTPTGTDTGYLSNSTPTLYGIIQRADGKWFNAGNSSIAFPAAPTPPNPPTGISYTATGKDVQIYFTKDGNATLTEIYEQASGNSTSTSISQFFFTVASYNTTYYYKLRSYNPTGGYGVYTSTLSFTSGSPPPSGLTNLVGTGVVDHIHVSWNASSGADSYTVSWAGYLSGSVTGITSLSRDVFLPTNHSYTVTVTPVNSSGSGSSMTTPTITLTDRPSNFNWTFNGYDSSGVLQSGTTKQSGYGFYLTNIEWNSFCNAINGFRTHVLGSGHSFTFTTPVTGQPFYAYMFNQAVTAINAMSPPIAIPSGTASTKYSGDTIYASYLNHLVTSLNSIV